MERNSILIQAGELLTKLHDPNIRLFDATIVDDVYNQEHIPGAAYFDHAKFSDPNSPYACAILPADKLAEQIGNAGIGNDSEVIVYACGMLPYAARAWWALRYAGHDNVRILDGGLDAWKNAGGMTAQEPRSYTPTFFRGEPRPEMFADREEVLSALQDSSIAVVDVLPQMSYEGAHITGSSNSSCMDLMQGMNYFQPNEQLAALLHAESKSKRIITYCGGGIAATINAIAHLMVGQENVAVYDGSMYEWIAEELPITGTGDWEIWRMKG